ncbi:inter-alpha-trypsin inhibitor-like [Rana temporaria]|uniref:inter-alpha-trypsin inhibitor-like n=1 Tax=Rana temporaria TaxID=8407 RepID=UPI001AACBC19|nr:inter-alpha-trypsin inhibitor-like [Rana temporaria]
MKMFLLFFPALLTAVTGNPVKTGPEMFYQIAENFEVIKRFARSMGDAEGSGDTADDTLFTENRAGSCHLHPSPGPCSANITRYFYNTSSMACESFQYGGCIGNHNNFNTEQQCIQTCRTKAACRIPIATGSCNTSDTRWAFEENQSKCVTFQYGGCKGNSNHFYTEKECKHFCEVLIADEEGFI